MKKLLISLFAVLIISPSYAQWNNYTPFPEDNAEWDVTHDGYECEICYKRYYHIKGDTLVNNKIFKKIMFKGYRGRTNYQTRVCDYWVYYDNLVYHGALLDDTTARKVYFVPAGSNTEFLLYDFTLNVGDPLPTGYNNYFLGSNAIIETIDLINVGSVLRKRYRIANTLFTEIIQGIGSTTGLTEDIFRLNVMVRSRVFL